MRWANLLDHQNPPSGIRMNQMGNLLVSDIDKDDKTIQLDGKTVVATTETFGDD